MWSTLAQQHMHIHSDTQALKYIYLSFTGFFCMSKSNQIGISCLLSVYEQYFLQIGYCPQTVDGHFKCQPDSLVDSPWSELGVIWTRIYAKVKGESSYHQVFYLETKKSKRMKPSETYSPLTSSRVFITEDNLVCTQG